MEDETQILTMLEEEYARWENLLAGMNEVQILAPVLPANLSLKDVIAHLWAWQQRSIERIEAALHNREPEFPGWPAELDPEDHEDLEATNAWIYRENHDRPWASVHRDWREGFQHFIELGKATPAETLKDTQKYAWLDGYSLYDVLLASYEHHHLEHLEPLLAFLRRGESKHA
jgi:hypothetical protein